MIIEIGNMIIGLFRCNQEVEYSKYTECRMQAAINAHNFLIYELQTAKDMFL